MDYLYPLAETLSANPRLLQNPAFLSGLHEELFQGDPNPIPLDELTEMLHILIQKRDEFQQNHKLD